MTDFSETSQIVGLFTRRHGLVPLIAKGAKRQSKKNTMSGPLDLLTSGEVVFVPAKESDGGGGGGSGRAGGGGSGGGQLGTLAAWELADQRPILRGNLPGLNAAMLCAEVTTHLVHPHDPHEELFLELQAALDLLAMPRQRARAMTAYVKAALVAAGFWPQFTGCLACGRPPGDGSVRFSPLAGGILCGASSLADPAVRSSASATTPCRVENSGTTSIISGRIAIALDRLALPAVLLASPPERPADETALATAMQILLTHIEMITDKSLRTRYLLAALFPVPSPKASGLKSS